LGQTCFAVQTRRQEPADDKAIKEDNTRLLLRAKITISLKSACAQGGGGVMNRLFFDSAMDGAAIQP
jgi:hypothetical protein